jgi:hypothetical protein
MTKKTWFYIASGLAVLLSAGCAAPGGNTSRTSFLEVASGGYSSSCPYFTKDSAGEAVLSWITQKQKTATTEVAYAVFNRRDQKFGEVHRVAATAGVEPHGENMPKMVFGDKGNALLFFPLSRPRPGNPYTAAVYYTSLSAKGRWKAARPLVPDTTKSFDQRYFDAAVLPSGRIGVVWLDNSTPSGSTLCFAAGGADGGFKPESVIGTHACQCCRTDLFVDDSGVHVAWREIYHDSIRDMAYAFSGNGGRTFTTPVRISRDNWVVNGCPHTGPSMARNSAGLHFAWFTMGGGGGVYYCHSTDNGLAFSPRQPVSEVPSARHPQIASLPGGDLAIVWDEGVKYGNRYHQRIGLQLRGPTGLVLGTRYVTPDSVNADFPQIAVLDDHHALLAYTVQRGDAQQVKCRLVSLTP